MKIQTLIYIKEMLEKEVENKERACKKIRERLAEAEDESGVQWNTPDSKVNGNVQAFRSMKETQRKLLNETKDALEDFLQKEWN